MDFVSHFLSGIAATAVFVISIINPFNLPTNKIVASPIPTPIIIEQPSPTPKVIPVQQNTYVDPDPITDCKSSHPSCLNQTIKGKQSECKNIYCCVYPDKAILLHDKSQCVSSPTYPAYPNSQTQTGSSSDPQVTCVLPQGTYQVAQSSCEWMKKAYAPLPIPSPQSLKDWQDTQNTYNEIMNRTFVPATPIPFITPAPWPTIGPHTPTTPCLTGMVNSYGAVGAVPCSK